MGRETKRLCLAIRFGDWRNIDIFTNNPVVGVNAVNNSCPSSLRSTELRFCLLNPLDQNGRTLAAVLLLVTFVIFFAVRQYSFRPRQTIRQY